MLELGNRSKCWQPVSKVFFLLFSCTTPKIFRNAVRVYTLTLLLAIFWGREFAYTLETSTINTALLSHRWSSVPTFGEFDPRLGIFMSFEENLGNWGNWGIFKEIAFYGIKLGKFVVTRFCDVKSVTDLRSVTGKRISGKLHESYILYFPYQRRVKPVLEIPSWKSASKVDHNHVSVKKKSLILRQVLEIMPQYSL